MSSLPSEDQIMANWSPTSIGPSVSICCVTYNHAPYIRDALNSFLLQKTSFPFEIIVHDDASTDGTDDIIQSYVAEYPRLFVPILQSENQFSKGVSPDVATFKRTLSPYLAFCEGDDFWCDETKLARQYAVMQAHPEVDLCTHSAFTGGHDNIDVGFGSDEIAVTVADVVSKSFRMPTASVMLRRPAALKFMAFAEARPHLPFGDLYFRFFGALRGGGIHIDRPMCINRAFAPGSWSARTRSSYEFMLDNRSRKLRSFLELDSISDGRFSGVFREETYRAMRFAALDKSIPIKRRIKFLLMHHDLLPARLNIRLAGALLKGGIW